MPEISAVMTVFNGGPYLREAVESILNQTYTGFEFLIVDNASTDGSLSYLRSLKDPRVRIMALETNVGQTRALNKAIQQAAGRWVARMDADDVSVPERLAIQLDYVKTHPKAVVVGSWTEEIDAQGRHLKFMKYPTDPVVIRCHLLSDGNLTRRCLAHPTVMMLKETVLAADGYNESVTYAQDYDLWTRLSRHHQIHNVDRILLKYRSFPESNSRRNPSAISEELDGIVSRNVAALAPNMPPGDRHRLVCMLRNQRPVSSENAVELYRLFDHFFELATHEWDHNPSRLRKIRDQIKMYYASRLFASDPLRTSLYAVKTFAAQPGALADIKLLKNIAKQILRR